MRSIPIIAVTSYALSGDERKGHEAGCNAYVTKPYSPRQLLAKIREFLQCDRRTSRNETITDRRKALAIMLAAGFGLAAVGLGHAQTYPNRVIRIIAPYTPGSPNDVMARLLRSACR